MPSGVVPTSGAMRLPVSGRQADERPLGVLYRGGMVGHMAVGVIHLHREVGNQLAIEPNIRPFAPAE